MFGNLVNNKQFNELLRTKVIEIEPLELDNLALVHFTVTIQKIKKKLPNGSKKTIHDFNEDPNPYTLEPNGYAIVQIREKIKLNDDNIIGQFVAASNLIEDGLAITAGKIDKKFGTTSSHNSNPEMIHFGLKNLTGEPCIIKPYYRIAHLSLFDLRGVATNKIPLSDPEIKLRMQRMLFGEPDGGDGVKY